jgi:hypothetical protein
MLARKHNQHALYLQIQLDDGHDFETAREHKKKQGRQQGRQQGGTEATVGGTKGGADDEGGTISTRARASSRAGTKEGGEEEEGEEEGDKMTTEERLVDGLRYMRSLCTVLTMHCTHYALTVGTCAPFPSSRWRPI